MVSGFELYPRWVPPVNDTPYIIDRQIAYVCETDQMAEFHTILTLIFNSDDLNLSTLYSGAFLV